MLRPMSLSSTLRDACRSYFDRGWTAMPLQNDDNGFPKKPFVPAWQELAHDWAILSQLPWDSATGLGLVLGRASSNLAVLDIDDEEMADVLFAMAPNTRCVRTIRKRGHMYVLEAQPTPSKRLTVSWRGREVTVELKAQGTQVAASPTPGYTTVSKANPLGVPSLPVLWQGLSKRLGVTVPVEASASTTRVWREKVPKDNRNNTIYVEAHRLREAGMPLESALGVLQSRWERDYEQGEQTWYEIERTIRSAYTKGVPFQRRASNASDYWFGR